MLPQQPRPLTDEDDAERFGFQMPFLERSWFERTFPAPTKFFDDKFHAGVYEDKDRWKYRRYSFVFTQSDMYGPGVTRIYAVCSVYPGWHYSVELSRIRTTTLAVVLGSTMLDKWR